MEDGKQPLPLCLPISKSTIASLERPGEMETNCCLFAAQSIKTRWFPLSDNKYKLHELWGSFDDVSNHHGIGVIPLCVVRQHDVRRTSPRWLEKDHIRHKNPKTFSKKKKKHSKTQLLGDFHVTRQKEVFLTLNFKCSSSVFKISGHKTRIVVCQLLNQS
jgi:hypothetical protein